jgi:hypothetical protein
MMEAMEVAVYMFFLIVDYSSSLEKKVGGG